MQVIKVVKGIKQPAEASRRAETSRDEQTDIAAHLYLSEGTVRNYVSAVFVKLGVSDRT